MFDTDLYAPYYYLKSWKSDIGSIIGVPLISGNGKSLGILFATKRHSFGFDPDDQAMLEAYANQAVIGLDNAQLLRQSLEREIKTNMSKVSLSSMAMAGLM